jgi:orotidine 5''-phosphate decarboxylase, subfamily 1
MAQRPPGLGNAADTPVLDRKNIPTRERLIFALDVPNVDQATRLVDALGDAVCFYKVGLELFMAGGYFELIDSLTQKGKKVFVDLKFFDVPQTVASAVKRLEGRGVSFTSVHGNDSILEAACQVKDKVQILAVTVLTSLDQRDIEDLGFKTDIQSLVLSRARRALALGCDGVISSGQEARALRQMQGDGFLIVMPGIRPVENRVVDDQKRTVDIEEAFRSGADYIVIGRPIRDASNHRETAEVIQKRIAALFDA